MLSTRSGHPRHGRYAVSVLLWLAALAAGGIAAGYALTRAPGRYVPRVREFTVVTVPLLTKEMQTIYPFLRKDFAPGGVLEGKEIYAFVPNTLTVVEGDTIHFTFVNPEDDIHMFVLQDLTVPLPGQSVRRATYVASRAGVFTFLCAVAAHAPAMVGQLVVLPAAVGRGFAQTASRAGAR